MLGLIGFSFGALCCWLLTIKCLKGCDWILVNGPNTMPKADKVKYKEQHDMVGLNRYIGKTILIPMSIIFSLVATGYAFSWEISDWIVIVAVVVALALSVRMFVAVPKILGTDFEKKTEQS